MSHFEKNALSKYKGNPPLFYKRYVDDTFLIFHDRDDCELFLEFVNLEHRNIKFTVELENDDSLPFLDVLVTRNDDRSISTSLYRKSTFSGLLMKFDSFVPQHFKHNLLFGLLNRAWKICSSYDLFYKEMKVIKQLLMSNGFTPNYVNKSVKLFLSKKHDVKDVKPVVHTCEKRTMFISLPYCGKNSLKLGRQLNRLMVKVAPWTKLNIVFKPVLRLKALSKLKSAVQTLNQSNVVYRINCTDCNDFYIGLTNRRLHKRLQEHKKRKYCAVYKHSETGHSIDWNNPQIIGHDNVKLRLQVKETLQIDHYAAHKSLNVNIDSFECKLW